MIHTSGRNTFAAGLLAVAMLAALSLGCASYTGTAKEAQPSALYRSGGWVMVPEFPLVHQSGTNDCGAAALAAVVSFWGRPTLPAQIEQSAGHEGTRLRAGELERYARSAGLSAYVFYGTMKDIVYELQRRRPVIVGLGKPYAEKKAVSHYEVVVGYEPKKRLVLLLDPGRGWQVDTYEGFAREWAVSKAVTLVAFLPASERKVGSR